MTRRIATALVGLLLVGGLAACGDDDDDATTDTTAAGTDTTATGTGDTAELVITGKDFEFEAPTEIDGGIVKVTFKNEGTTQHEAVILDIGDTPLDQFKTDFPPVLEGGPIPDYMQALGGSFEIPAGEERVSTQALPEGDYYIFCALQTDAGEEEAPDDVTGREPHYNRGMVQTLTVTSGDASASGLPLDGGSVIAIETSADAYTFQSDGLTAGQNDVAFVNAADNKELHFLDIEEFPEGTTEEQAAAAMETLFNLEEGQAPPEGTPAPETIAGTSVFSPGFGGTVSVDLKSGRTYALLCFIQDRAGGPPHAIAKGMRKFVTIP